VEHAFETIRVELPARGVALLTLDRPEQGNSVVPEMARDLMAVLGDLEEDLSIRALVITGAGKHFSAGADLFALHDYLQNELATKQEPFNARVLSPVTQKIAACRLPIIAAVNGSATAGGLDLALACDLRVASTAAKFGETYVRVGLAPGNGGAWFLPRLVGSGRAAEMALTGDLITAEDALEIGLVNRLVVPEELLPTAVSIGERIAANPWRAVEATKQALRASWQQDLAGAMNFGYWTAAALHHTDDFQGRVEAFVNRRAREQESP
jgi:enoyl-CoA hydratase/carnithine racemase